MTVEEIKEFKETSWHDKDKYATKGRTDAALGFGIAGTALAAWSLFGRRGRLGVDGTPENININGVGMPGLSSVAGYSNYIQNGPTPYQVEQKECEDVLNLTSAFYNQALLNQSNRFNDRQVLNGELFGLYKNQSDADFNLYKNQRDGFDVLKAEIDGLRTEVAVGAAIRPYQDKLIQCEIDRAYVSGINYTDRRTCRMIEGELVLPSTPVVTGYGSYGSRCNCRNGSANSSNSK